VWNPDAVCLSNDVTQQTYSLSDDILAMEIVPAVAGEVRLGPIAKIPEGADLECCGQGFNERTVKVRWRGKVYFVFLQDLESQCKAAGSYHAELVRRAI